LYTDDGDAEELADIYDWRGLAWADKGNKEMACSDFGEAMCLDPDNKEYEEHYDSVEG
jgi:hypothetical protein